MKQQVPQYGSAAAGDTEAKVASALAPQAPRHAYGRTVRMIALAFATVLVMCLGATLLSAKVSHAAEGHGLPELDTVERYWWNRHQHGLPPPPPPSAPSPPVAALFKVNDFVTVTAWDHLNPDDLNAKVQKHGARFGKIAEIRHVPIADKNIPSRKNFKYDRDTCPDEGCSNTCAWTAAQKAGRQAKFSAAQARIKSQYQNINAGRDANGGDRRVLVGMQEYGPADYSTQQNPQYANDGVCNDGSHKSVWQRDCTDSGVCKNRKRDSSHRCARGTDCADCGYCTRTRPEYRVVFKGISGYHFQHYGLKSAGVFLKQELIRKELPSEPTSGAIVLKHHPTWAVVMLPRDPKQVGGVDPTTNYAAPDLFISATHKATANGEHLVTSGGLKGWAQLQKLDPPRWAASDTITGTNWARAFYRPAPPPKAARKFKSKDAACVAKCMAWTAAALFVFDQKGGVGGFSFGLSTITGSLGALMKCEKTRNFYDVASDCFDIVPYDEDKTKRSYDSPHMGGKTKHLPKLHCLHNQLVNVDGCATKCPCDPHKTPGCIPFEVLVHLPGGIHGWTSGGNGVKKLKAIHTICDGCAGTCNFLQKEARTKSKFHNNLCADDHKTCGGRDEVASSSYSWTDLGAKYNTCGKVDGGHKNTCYNRKWQWGFTANSQGGREIRLQNQNEMYDAVHEGTVEYGHGDSKACLTADGPIKNGVPITIKPCYGTHHHNSANQQQARDDSRRAGIFQRWKREGDNIVLLYRGKRMCLNLGYYARHAGAIIDLWECNGHPAQKWANHGV